MVRTVYYKYPHPKEALISDGILNRAVGIAAGKASLGSDPPNDARLALVLLITLVSSFDYFVFLNLSYSLCLSFFSSNWNGLLDLLFVAWPLFCYHLFVLLFSLCNSVITSSCKNVDCNSCSCKRLQNSSTWQDKIE